MFRHVIFSLNAPNTNLTREASHSTFIAPVAGIWFVLYRRRRLCDVFFVIYDRLNRRVQRVYPFPDTAASDFHSAIPQSIRKDFAEARRC
jgi:hypothetical protein